ncbi:MAG: phosphopentomutase [Clostridia bacterium]|nr:phosphopentomutase [Clostridia bacterium]
MKIKRVFLIVLDSCGAGELPDAADFGDVGANTIRSVSRAKSFKIDTLRRMGYGNIEGLDFLGRVDNPTAAVARLAERSRGKDTTIGHWEIAGVVSDAPLPTYTDGFPAEVLDEFEMATGRGVLCNKPYSGTAVIHDYGREHIESGKLIVYTSADSVFQIAAHEDVVPVETLYEYCRAARKILTGKHAVGRVIARPFTGEFPNYIRTPRRHDFSLEPPEKTVLDALSAAGYDTIGVGKISDIFAGRGISKSYYTRSNAEGMNITSDVTKQDFNGLCFVNLVDFDSLFGHRRDAEGYAAALAEFDTWLGGWLNDLQDDDIVMITADHGCDPDFAATTDHTREYVPLFVWGKAVKPENLGTRATYADIAATVADIFDVPLKTEGNSFAHEVMDI